MSKKKLRSMKEINKQIRAARSRDEEAEKELARLGRSMLDVCKENNVEPETMLVQLGLLTSIARRELVRKHSSEFIDPKQEPPGGKEKKVIIEDFQRMLTAISRQCDEAREDPDGNVDEPGVGKAQEGNRAGAKKKKDDRPHYIA